MSTCAASIAAGDPGSSASQLASRTRIARMVRPAYAMVVSRSPRAPGPASANCPACVVRVTSTTTAPALVASASAGSRRRDSIASNARASALEPATRGPADSSAPASASARASEKTDAGADAGRGRGRRRSQYRPYTHARATSAQASHTSCRRAIGDERSGRREHEEEDAESERAGESAKREAVPFAFLIAPFRVASRHSSTVC